MTVVAVVSQAKKHVTEKEDGLNLRLVSSLGNITERCFSHKNTCTEREWVSPTQNVNPEHIIVHYFCCNNFYLESFEKGKQWYGKNMGIGKFPPSLLLSLSLSLSQSVHDRHNWLILSMKGQSLFVSGFC